MLEGYAWQTSFDSGNRFDFCLSTCGSPRGRAQWNVFAVGNPAVIASGVVDVDDVPKPADAYRNGCAWPRHSIHLDKALASGLYYARFVLGQESCEVFFPVRANPAQAKRILLMTCDLTVQAYNSWGGRSTYGEGNFDNLRRSHRVSFERPINSWQKSGYHREISCWQWLRERYAVDCCSQLDILDYAFLERYQLLLSVGHDEYWTSEMRDNVERFVREGGNVAFFSGNVCYWQVRLGSGRVSMTCFKSAAADPLSLANPERTTIKWWQSPVERPNNRMTGAGGELGGYNVNGGRYTRVVPDHWVFNGLAAGADAGPIGYEIDGVALDQNGRPTYTDGTPTSFELLARGQGGDMKPGFAAMGLYRNNGLVFSSGSVDWYPGNGDDNTAIIATNVLNRLQYPPGQEAPAWKFVETIAIRPASLTGFFGDPTVTYPTAPWLYALGDGGKVWRRRAITAAAEFQQFGTIPSVLAVTALGNLSAEDSLLSGVLASANNSLLGATAEGIYLLMKPATPEAQTTSPGTITALGFGSTHLFALRADSTLWEKSIGDGWKAAAWEAIAAPAGETIISIATAFADLFAVTASKKLYFHPMRWPAQWSANEWLLLDNDTDVDLIAAADGKLFGYNKATGALSWRDMSPSHVPLVLMATQSDYPPVSTKPVHSFTIDVVHAIETLDSSLNRDVELLRAAGGILPGCECETGVFALATFSLAGRRYVFVDHSSRLCHVLEIAAGGGMVRHVYSPKIPLGMVTQPVCFERAGAAFVCFVEGAGPADHQLSVYRFRTDMSGMELLCSEKYDARAESPTPSGLTLLGDAGDKRYLLRHRPGDGTIHEIDFAANQVRRTASVRLPIPSQSIHRFELAGGIYLFFFSSRGSDNGAVSIAEVRADGAGYDVLTGKTTLMPADLTRVHVLVAGGKAYAFFFTTPPPGSTPAVGCWEIIVAERSWKLEHVWSGNEYARQNQRHQADTAFVTFPV